MEGPGDNVLTKRLLLLHRVSSDIFQKVPSFSCLHLICWGNPGCEFRSGSEKKNESHCKAFLFCFISFSVKTLATACLGLFCILSLLCADIWKSHISLCVVIPGWRLLSAFESSKAPMTHSSSLCWNWSSRKIHWDSYKQKWLLKHPLLTCTRFFYVCDGSGVSTAVASVVEALTVCCAKMRRSASDAPALLNTFCVFW